MTKREKRKQKEKDRGIVDFMMVTHHFSIVDNSQKAVSTVLKYRNKKFIPHR